MRAPKHLFELLSGLKKNITDLSRGLELVRPLRPVRFRWEQEYGGTVDMGFIAEEVAGVEPLLANYNEKGEISGVKYDRIGVVAVSAIKEQQAQIGIQSEQIAAEGAQIRKQQEQLEKQQLRIDQQQILIDGLKKLACQTNAETSVCRERQ